jgi:hypothetical protein
MLSCPVGMAQTKMAHSEAFKGLPTIRSLGGLRPFVNQPLPGSDFECLESGRVCRITVHITPDDVCTAKIDGYFTVPPKTKPRMVWKLDLSAVASDGATYEFHPVYGVLLTSDPNHQLDRGKSGRGDDEPSAGPGIHPPADVTRFHWKSHKNDARSTVVYVPIVLRTLGDEITVCTPKDPRIVNDG